MMIREAPFARATAAVVKARKVSITATAPVAFLAPSKRLWIEIFIAAAAPGHLRVAFGRALREHLGHSETGRANDHRRRPNPSLGKGHAFGPSSPGALFNRTGDCGHGRCRCRPGAGPPGTVGPGLKRAGAGGGHKRPRTIRVNGLVISRRSTRARYRCELEGATGDGRPALLYERPTPAILVHRRHARLAVAGGGAGRGAGVAGGGD